MFYSIKNHVDQQAVAVAKPWELVNNAPYGMKKAEFTGWCKHFTTDHVFLSLDEGVSPNVRISAENNPVHQSWGFFVDYDRVPQEGFIEHMIKHPAIDGMLPAWISRSKSDRVHAVWEFEAPYRYANQEHCEEFKRYAAEKMKLNDWLHGFDSGAFVKSTQYFELGKNWQKVSDDKIPTSTLCAWDFVAFAKVAKNMSPSYDGIDVTVPMEVVADEVGRLYPNRWSGKFEPGAKGLRFWDPKADNVTAVMVCDHGVQVFNTPHTSDLLGKPDKVFMDWKYLFGEKFIEKYIGDRTKKVKDHVFVDKRHKYWYEQAAGRWSEMGIDSLSRKLRVLGFDDRREKGRTYSEQDLLIGQIEAMNEIDYAAPVIYRPVGLFTNPDNGERILNTQSIMPVRPAAPTLPPNCPWGEAHRSFPMLHRVLSFLFVEHGVDNDTPEWLGKYEPDIQLNVLLAWMKRSYEGGLRQSPRLGQTLIVVGGKDKGKTFLTNRVIGGLLGGCESGKEVLIDGSPFTEKLTRSPVVTLDDPAENKAQHTAFEQRLKQISACGVWRSEKKFGDARDVPWPGRFVFCCNDDAISRQMLPGLSASNKDKVIMLLCGSQVLRMSPDRDKNNAKVAMELPNFGRWLLDWTPPAEAMQGDDRYEVTAFHHPKLVLTIDDAGRTGTLLSILDHTFRMAPKNADGTEFWTGAGTELYELLCSSAPNAMRGIQQNSMTTTLSILEQRGCKLSDGVNRKRQKLWIIPHDVSKIQPMKKEVATR